MDKTITTPQYKLFLRVLRNTRKEFGLSQVDVASRLAETQSFVSKCERGERRIDILELRRFCEVYGLPLVEFVRRLEQVLGDPPPRRTGARK